MRSGVAAERVWWEWLLEVLGGGCGGGDRGGGLTPGSFAREDRGLAGPCFFSARLDGLCASSGAWL